MIQLFSDLSLGAKIVWIIFAAIFAYSIYVAVSTKGKEGGIAAGVITGIVVFAFIIMNNKSLVKWIDGFKYAEWYIFIAVFVGCFLSLVIFSLMVMASVKSNINPDFKGSFPAVIFRILGTAGCVITILFAYSLISNGGVIFYYQ